MVQIMKSSDIRGKKEFFKYLYSKRPIIVIGPSDSEIEQIMNEFKCGKYFTQDKKELLYSYLEDCYRKFKKLWFSYLSKKCK